jgi:UDP-glucose 4-epimerase
MGKCLVIGGNGFLGSHLVDTLAAAGHEVSAFDRFSSGTQNYTATNVTAITGDFLDRSHLSHAVTGQEFVFHFLSVTTPASAESDPTLDIRTNLAQTVDLFEFCADAGVRRLFFASSGGAIYGASKNQASAEIDPTWPVSPYGIIKLAIENYLGYFKATRGLEHTIFRISNPYGPRQGPTKTQGLIPVVLNRIARGLPITRFGDGTMIRDFVYVDDLMQMVSRALSEEVPHDVYNLGHGEGHSVNEIFESIRRVTGRNFAVVEKPSPPTFLERSVLDVSRFNSDFGPVEYTKLDDGIRATWETLPSHIEASF